jgi:hypothetical protein
LLSPLGESGGVQQEKRQLLRQKKEQGRRSQQRRPLKSTGEERQLRELGLLPE